MSNHIFLIGFMGSGKSTIGQNLARRMAREFIDLDLMVEKRMQGSIREVFARIGENGFRVKEQETLHLLQHHSPAIVATGGGTPCFFDNMAWMNQQGITIFLNPSVEALVQRLQSHTAERPLIKDLAPAELDHFVRNKLKERMFYYSQSRIQVIDIGDIATMLTSLVYLLNEIN
jgi:shikimate kinase